jgi:Zn finger protein HypA/HybF involved in hydrogenase expression
MNVIRVNCLECNNEFNKRTTEIKRHPNNFCSRSCAGKYNNRKYPKKELKGLCLHCKIKIPSKNLFCSNQCKQNSHFNTQLQKIKENLIREPKTIKNVLNTINKNCWNCKLPPIWDNKILIMQLDHIDGNSDNNFLDNLRLLCPNCHTQTETFSTRQKKNTVRNRYLRKSKGYKE